MKKTLDELVQSIFDVKMLKAENEKEDQLFSIGFSFEEEGAPFEFVCCMFAHPLKEGFPKFKLSYDNINQIKLAFDSALQSCSNSMREKSKYDKYYVECAEEFLENGLSDSPKRMADPDVCAIEKCKLYAKENMPWLFDE